MRLFGADRVLREALTELAALPEDAWEKSVATPLLVHFRPGSEAPATNEKEDDVSSEIRALFEEYQQKLRAEARKEGRSEGRYEGWNEGRNEGRAEEATRAVLTALRVRGIAVSDAARERILTQKDPEILARWHERAVVAALLDQVLDEPS